MQVDTTVAKLPVVIDRLVANAERLRPSQSAPPGRGGVPVADTPTQRDMVTPFPPLTYPHFVTALNACDPQVALLRGAHAIATAKLGVACPAPQLQQLRLEDCVCDDLIQYAYCCVGASKSAAAAMAGIRVGFLCGICEGYGDLVFAARALTALQQSMPRAELQVFAPLEHLSKLTTLLRSTMNAPYPPIRGYRPDPQDVFDLVIVGPAAPELERDRMVKLMGRSPVLAVSEYDLRQFGELWPELSPTVWLESGLRSSAAGIFIDAALRQEAEKLRGDRQAQRACLQELASALGPALLGDSAAESYLDTTDLAFCYASDTASFCDFIGSLTRHEAFEQKKLDMLISAGSHCTPEMLASDVLRAMQRVPAEIRPEVVVLSGPQPSPNPTDLGLAGLQAPNGRRVLIAPVLTPRLFQRALLASRIVGVTGDQSLSEAISAKKIFIYHARPHKRHLKVALSSLYELLPTHTCSSLTSLLWVNELRQARGLPPLPPLPPQEHVDSLYDCIAQQHDLRPQLQSAALRTFLLPKHADLTHHEDRLVTATLPLFADADAASPKETYAAVLGCFDDLLKSIGQAIETDRMVRGITIIERPAGPGDAAALCRALKALQGKRETMPHKRNGNIPL